MRQENAEKKDYISRMRNLPFEEIRQNRQSFARLRKVSSVGEPAA